mmetsp:Transcript_11/g.50  ORF Transcript_11/g.50 Transcript_11/m.50 type:complete len:460 (-) Transcript_11:34-1413(-)
MIFPTFLLFSSVLCGSTHYFTEQRLDHFNGADSTVWSQRYFVNTSFGTTGGPVFLQLGGEGELGVSSVDSYAMTMYGQQQGALLVGLEHRFYSAHSMPKPDLSLDSLRYLSSQQALADAAYFVNVELRSKYPQYDFNKVVVFGGSYSGALAAWAREKYPGTFLIGVASSAPVRAELDFLEYLDVVDKALEEEFGELCVSAISSATAKAEALLDADAGKLSSMFSLCSPLDANDDKSVANFFSYVAGTFMGTVQYNGENPSAPNIRDLCKAMTNTSNSPLHNLASVTKQFNDPAGCLDVDYESMIKQLRNTTLDPAAPVGMRQWTYQTCTQFGYFQTTDSAKQPFGSRIPISFYTDMCNDAFANGVQPNINFTNAYYGGVESWLTKANHGTYVIFANGLADPWHALSVYTKPVSENIAVFTCDVCAHCENMEPYREGLPIGVKEVQGNISATLDAWLAKL